MPSSPPRGAYIRSARPRPRASHRHTQRGDRPIGAAARCLPPAPSFTPTTVFCGQCLTANSANSAELRRGQGFRRWPIVVAPVVGSAAATKPVAANPRIQTNANAISAFLRPLTVLRLSSPWVPRCPSTRERTAPKRGGECPLLLLFQPLLVCSSIESLNLRNRYPSAIALLASPRCR